LIVALVGELLLSETEELQADERSKGDQVALLSSLDCNSDGEGTAPPQCSAGLINHARLRR
jgi:hypothetical protein